MNKQTTALADVVFSLEQIKEEASSREIIEMPVDYFKQQYLTYLHSKIQALLFRIEQQNKLLENGNEMNEKPVMVMKTESVYKYFFIFYFFLYFYIFIV